MPTHLHAHRRQHSHHKIKHLVMSPIHLRFIADASLAAQSSEMGTGVPASVTIAQAIVESAWGHHHMGSANNYFGVKAQEDHGHISYGNIATGYVVRSTQEHLKKLDKDVTVDAYFRSYAGMADSFRDHGAFLQDNARYKKILADYAKTGDADAFAQGLQDAGYATDPHYAHLLISIMRRNNLYRYNQARKN